MRTKISLSAIAIVLGGLLVAGTAISNPVGVPVGPAQLTCTTLGSGWTVTLVDSSGGTLGARPYATPCTAANAGKTCTAYQYKVTGPGGTPDHVLLAVSGDQDLDTALPLQGASVAVPGGAGDTKTNFLQYAQHEYAIRMNPSSGNLVAAVIVGASVPRISTVLVTKGRTAESCLIAGPGIPGDPFQPVIQSQTSLVAGGRCQVNLTYDALGNVVDVNPVPGSSCSKYSGPVEVKYGSGLPEPLRNNSGPHGITFGNGTTTCYGPPVPSIPKCICTTAQCP